MLVSNPNIGMLGAKNYFPNGVNYDGSSAYMDAVSLTGLADGPLGIYSSWLKLTGRDGAARHIFNFGGGDCTIRFLSSNNLFVNLQNAAASAVCAWQSTATTFIADNIYHHYAFAWDTNHAAGSRVLQVYRDGGLVAGSLITDTGIAFSVAAATGGGIFGVESQNTNFFQGGVAETYINLSATLDLSVPTNLQKFRDVNGNPVDLGPAGAGPTGSSPLVLLKNVAASRGTNSGTGGNLTTHGTITDIQGP